MDNLKIAIFVNFLDNIGGAENLSLILASELCADIYTTNFDHDKINRMGFTDINIFSIGKVPRNAPFRQQLTLTRFRKLNLKKKYDLYLITGDWAISGAVNNKPNIEYFHSPANEIWEFKPFVRSLLEPWKQPLFDIWVLYNRYLYKQYFRHVENRIANSENTRRRIKKYLDNTAVVVHPPVETHKYRYNKNGDFWLSVNRLTPHKRIDLQLRAFSKLPEEKLIIVGSYEKGAKHFEVQKNHLEKLKPENVVLKTWVTQQELIELYANCKGFITTAQNEDFGMTPLEAMASGKPVIACNEGGYKETIISGKTGILIENITSDALAEAICRLKDSVAVYKEACIDRAREFDTVFFINKIKKIMSDSLQEKHS